MHTQSIDAMRAAQILFGPQFYEREFDPAGAQFAPGGDIGPWLASAFGFTEEDYRQLHAAQFPATVSVAEWKSREDGSGILDKVRTKSIGEVFQEVRAIVGDNPDGAEDYFQVAYANSPPEEWPAGEIVCFSMNGTSEGDYTHVEVHTEARRTLCFIGKTFMGRDASWAFARRLADILEIQ